MTMTSEIAGDLLEALTSMVEKDPASTQVTNYLLLALFSAVVAFHFEDKGPQDFPLYVPAGPRGEA